MKHKNTQKLTLAAMTAAAYAALSLLGAVFGLTFGPIQVRFSEALCLLPFLFPETAWGLRPILCANLPYNITTPLLTRVVESRCFDSVTVLIQKEVAQRICAAPGTADYGAFSLLMQYYTRPELVFEVPNTCFLPAPKVTSAVIHCPARREPPVQVCSEAMLWRTVRAGFALRRKTLVNSLQTGFPLPKDQLAAIVTGCGLPENVRGERLSLADYAALANALAAVM